MKSIFRSFSLLCVCAASALLSSGLLLTSCHKQHKEASAEAMPIDVAKATVDSITLYRTYPATLRALKTVDLVARVNGYLNAVNYESGQLVEKGAVLFTIESQTYADAVRQAEAQLANAESQYAYSSQQYAAMKKALESDAVSQMEVLQAKNEMEAAEASIRQAKAALETARTNLSYCTVRAPFRGRVSDNIYQAGTYLSGAGAPVTLATIYDESAMNIDFYVEDGNIPHVASDGKPTGKISYDSIPMTFNEKVSHPYSAFIWYMDPAVDKSTGTLLVKARVLNPQGELRAGMYATVHLPYDDDPHAVMVQDAAISTDQLGKYLYTVNDSNRVVYTPIEVGDLYDDTLRVVNKGIAPGTMYVTKALLKVRDGMTVKPVVAQ